MALCIAFGRSSGSIYFILKNVRNKLHKRWHRSLKMEEKLKNAVA